MGRSSTDLREFLGLRRKQLFSSDFQKYCQIACCYRPRALALRGAQSDSYFGNFSRNGGWIHHTRLDGVSPSPPGRRLFFLGSVFVAFSTGPAFARQNNQKYRSAFRCISCGEFATVFLDNSFDDGNAESQTIWFLSLGTRLRCGGGFLHQFRDRCREFRRRRARPRTNSRYVSFRPFRPRPRHSRED